MLAKLLGFFIGSYTISVQPESTVGAINVLKKYFFNVHVSGIAEDGSFKLMADSLTARRMCKAFDEADVAYSISKLSGLPRTLCFLVKRPGIILGALTIFVLSFFSSRMVWGFDVVGNVTVPDEEILMLLDDLGCGYGDYIPAMDLDSIRSMYLAISDNISWISVNLKGNFATVEVIETKKGGSPAVEEGVYANIIAAEDAEIYLVKSESGVPSVSIGRVVKKGEILISGVIDVREDRVRYEYAKGEVLAYVPRTIEVKIPFERQVKVYTGEEKSEKSIKIFKKTINLFTKGGIEYTIYDKIEDDRQVCLFGRYVLPIRVIDVTYREYEYVTDVSSVDITVAEAMSEFRSDLDAILESAEIVSNKISYEITEEDFIIRCDLLCLTDIGEIMEFTVDAE